MFFKKFDPALRGMFKIIQIVKSNKSIVLQTPDAKPVRLIVDVPENGSVAVTQAATPSVRCSVLRSRPPVAVVANIEERANDVAIATRKGSKTAAVSAVVSACPMACTGFKIFFHNIPFSITWNMPTCWANIMCISDCIPIV